MTTRFVLPALLLAGCSIDPDRVIFRCDPAHPCPQGLVCLSNQTCGPGASGDLGGVSDLTPAYGCTVPNGQAIGRAWACPVGMLSKGQASGLCGTGYKLCTSATALDGDSRCRTIAGFFAAQVIGSAAGGPDSAQCGSTSNPFQVFYGCGRIELNYVFQVVMPCNGFERVIDCNDPDREWLCGRTLDDTSTTVSAGVLCCPVGS